MHFGSSGIEVLDWCLFSKVNIDSTAINNVGVMGFILFRVGATIYNRR